MRKIKKTAIFLVITLIACSLLTVTAFAAAPENESADSGKLDMNLNPEGFSERLEFALQGTATGMLMVFGVLTLLTLILYGSKFVFYDIPNKKREKSIAAARSKQAEKHIADKEIPESQPTAVRDQAQAVSDDGELAAVITAAIAAMLEKDEYKNEFVGGFRVVSFKKSTKGAWNRK